MSESEAVIHGTRRHDGRISLRDSIAQADHVAVYYFRRRDLWRISFCLRLSAVRQHRLATPFKFSPSIVNVIVMTFVLITSSLTMLGAVDAAKLGDKAKAARFLWSTIFLGALFAGLHIREWLGLIHEGVRLFNNPWGSPLFGATFFGITGLHLLHVVSGVIALIVIWRGYTRGSLTAGHVETTGLYWHFVDLVWMFVVPMVYLLSIQR